MFGVLTAGRVQGDAVCREAPEGLGSDSPLSPSPSPDHSAEELGYLPEEEDADGPFGKDGQSARAGRIQRKPPRLGLGLDFAFLSLGSLQSPGELVWIAKKPHSDKNLSALCCLGQAAMSGFLLCLASCSGSLAERHPFVDRGLQ